MKFVKRFQLSIVPFLIFSVFNSQASAQLVIDGGTLKISSGASVVSTGAITNNSGTIVNDGKLEARKSFINNGTYNSTTGDDSLLLTDVGLALLKGGGSVFQYISVDKAGGRVALAGTTVLGKKLDLLAGGFTTDSLNTFELVAPASAMFAFAPGLEIVGKVRRTNWTNGTAVVFNHPNMTVTTNGGEAPAGILVNMVPNGDPPLVEREVKRSFYFTPAGGSNYTADVTFPYNENELNSNTAANLAPWYNASSTEWSGKLTGTSVNTTSRYVSASGIDASVFANKEWKLADPRYTFNVTALLRGPWNGTAMSTSVNSTGLLPLSQPYNTTPFNYQGTESVTAIPNSNVVDWVLLELRKPLSGLAEDASSSTIAGHKAAFLLDNGRIVDLDGVTPVSFDIDKQGSSFMVVRHLNHLGIMSKAIASSAAGTFTNDFSVLANSYRSPASPSDPVVSLAGGRYGLWAGDANKNGSVNATDVSLIKSAIANSLSGYLLTDINRSNSINATDVSITKSTIAASGSGSGARIAPAELKTSIPN